MPDDLPATQPVRVAYGPLVDGLPLCASCFTGQHACTGGGCSCNALVCQVELLRDLFMRTANDIARIPPRFFTRQ